MLTCAPGGPRALPSQVGAGSRKQFLVDKVYLWAFLASFSSHTSHCCPSLPLAISHAACHLASPRALAMHMGAAHFCGLSLPPAAPLPCSLHRAGVDQGSPAPSLQKAMQRFSFAAPQVSVAVTFVGHQHTEPQAKP